MAKATILVIEDDPEIRELLSFSLGKEGWTVVAAEDGEGGLAKLPSANPDCVVLDIMLPGMDGLEVLKALKAEPARKRLPVIMTTAKGEEADVVAGLELGAEDYVVKPYSPRVLVARIRAALRRSYESQDRPSGGDAKGTGGRAAGEAALAVGDIRLDPAKHEVRVEGRKVELSATEFAILELLIRNPGWVFSRSRIIDSVKGRDYPVTDRAVDVQILSLRRKLGERGEDIETVRGVGYRLKD
jgi:two-component system phosphate regulon response regulator PhoB